MSSNVNSSFIILSILLVVLAKSDVAAAENEVEELCSRTINPTICERFLNSELAAKTTDVSELVQFLLVSIYMSANDTIGNVKDLANEATDPVEKKSYKSCLESYVEVVDILDKMKGDFKSQDCTSATIAVVTAQAFVDDCNNDIMGISEEIKQRNELITAVGSTLAVVCNTAKEEL